ncbi:type II toxin-antitoxin system ParD family antitoxin [Aquirufa ecclesiirivi]|uniref:type II toxin-antitoxin system ParD family antitoxin n=1 Tax=Aquirufa ecclesiirivi TaxID=2715124 RepID=UPI0022A93D08|nr:type II toxin-antitoxin system ParD family antitoxin [Aquirufa ecclesiirivi]MDF0692299.1 type II toxin-antitoxin system ParD family antitoxin [Aquirufa ecclesiirivi]
MIIGINTIGKLPIFGNFIRIKLPHIWDEIHQSLGNHFENFIQNSIDDGRYTNASEVIRAGLRLLEDKESKVIALRKAVNDGIASGRSIHFDPKKHL